MMKQLASALIVVACTLGWGWKGVAGLEELKDGAVWRDCERYYLSVEDYRKTERHYIIKDLSLAFMKAFKELRPRTKTEASLFVECINLANGNATFAFEEIQRLEAEDDAFFESARIDATNNSNATQWEYMAAFDGNKKFGLELDLAKENYETMLFQERRAATGQIGYSTNFSLGISGGGYNIGFSNFNPLAFASPGWSQSSSGSGGGASGSAPASNVTLAPVGGGGGAAAAAGGTSQQTANAAQSGAAQSSGSQSGGPQSPGPQPGGQTAAGAKAPGPQLANKDRGPPADALLQPAPHVDPDCASYRVTSAEAGMAQVENLCDVPIVFYWCWVPVGAQSCEPGSLSDVVAPDQTAAIHGPAKGERRTASYVVCDASDPEQICRK